MVSLVDSGGNRHSVEIAAESLYEAAALAVKEFRRPPWTDGIEPGTLTQLEVNIKAPMTTHNVRIRQLEKWIGRSAKSPQEIMLKARVRALLYPKSDAG